MKKNKCEDCGKVIPKDYLPSNFCPECVGDYMENIQTTKPKKAQIHPEFH